MVSLSVKRSIVFNRLVTTYTFGSKCSLSPAAVNIYIQQYYLYLFKFTGQSKCDKERRVTTDVTAIVLTIGGPDEIYTYKPPKVIPVIPSFPTKSGITKTQANHICKLSIKGSKLFKVCREAIGVKFTIQGFLGQCVTDIEVIIFTCVLSILISTVTYVYQFCSYLFTYSNPGH